jgi:hypothetical protein
MVKELGWNTKSLAYILSKQKGIVKLLKYVGRTERFKNTYGEVDPS